LNWGCTFLGLIGVYRFYVGKVTSGIFQILTFGGLGVWTLIDWIMILGGSFKDKDGFTIKNWNTD
jgi:TM2 domain-containing membrane protein YozV